MISGKARLSVTVLVVAGLVALAGCSGGGSPGGSATTPPGAAPGAFGSMPAEAAGAQAAGTITMAAPASFTLTWILPIINASFYYTTPMIDYQLYRPLY